MDKDITNTLREQVVRRHLEGNVGFNSHLWPVSLSVETYYNQVRLRRWNGKRWEY